MPNRSTIALALLLPCLAAGPAVAATCHMTLQGRPILGDVECSLAGRRGDATVSLPDGGAITVRHSVMRARLLGRPRPDGSRRFFARSFGPVVVSDASEADDRTCFFNQKAVLCVDP